MSLPTLNMINVNLQKISLIPITRHPSWHSVLLLQCLQDKKTSIGNWIQCREVLDTGVACGKWRRYTLHSKWLLFLYSYDCAYTTMLTHNVTYVYAFFTAWTFGRAPLFVVQSSNWDCSCSVIWDPIHADCAVPQVHSCYTWLRCSFVFYVAFWEGACLSYVSL